MNVLKLTPSTLDEYISAHNTKRGWEAKTNNIDTPSYSTGLLTGTYINTPGGNGRFAILKPAKVDPKPLEEDRTGCPGTFSHLYVSCLPENDYNCPLVKQLKPSTEPFNVPRGGSSYSDVAFCPSTEIARQRDSLDEPQSRITASKGLRVYYELLVRHNPHGKVIPADNCKLDITCESLSLPPKRPPSEARLPVVQDPPALKTRDRFGGKKAKPITGLHRQIDGGCSNTAITNPNSKYAYFRPTYIERKRSATFKYRKSAIQIQRSLPVNVQTDTDPHNFKPVLKDIVEEAEDEYNSELESLHFTNEKVASVGSTSETHESELILPKLDLHSLEGDPNSNCITNLSDPISLSPLSLSTPCHSSCAAADSEAVVPPLDLTLCGSNESLPSIISELLSGCHIHRNPCPTPVINFRSSKNENRKICSSRSRNHHHESPAEHLPPLKTQPQLQKTKRLHKRFRKPTFNDVAVNKNNNVNVNTNANPPQDTLDRSLKEKSISSDKMSERRSVAPGSSTSWGNQANMPTGRLAGTRTPTHSESQAGTESTMVHPQGRESQRMVSFGKSTTVTMSSSKIKGDQTQTAFMAGLMASIGVAHIQSAVAPADGKQEKPELYRGQNATDLEHCKSCGLGLWKPESRIGKVISMSFIFLTFADTYKLHPYHFTKIVHDEMSIFGIKRLIMEETEISASTLMVFKDRTRLQDSVLRDESATLAECGFVGSSWFEPVDHVLYYDYSTEFVDCPVLIADHFFAGPKPKRRGHDADHLH